MSHTRTSHEPTPLTAETKAELATFSKGMSHELHTNISHTHMSHELTALTAGDRSRVGSVFYRYESRTLYIHISHRLHPHMSHEPSTFTAEAEVELALFSTSTGHEHHIHINRAHMI